MTKIFDLRFVNTICYPTKRNQEQIKDLAKIVDIMIIIGSFTSANSKRLTSLSKDLNNNTYQVTDELELDDKGVFELLQNGITTAVFQMESRGMREYLIKLKPISLNVKEFVGGTLFEQRKTLIQLLIKKNDPEFQYLAYLLYDLLSNDNNNTVDTVEQTVLFDSLPWNIKKLFRNAMKTTINYTKYYQATIIIKYP